MSHTPHELAEDFPGHEALIRDLKMNNAVFQRLFERYHDVNRAVHRAETNIEPIGAFAEEDLRKERMVLKDQIAAMLRAA